MASETAQSEEIASLYRRAFEEFGASALWSSRAVKDPGREDALAITWSLRVEGDMRPATRRRDRVRLPCH